MPEATKKDIGKAFKAIVAVLQSEEGVSLLLLSHCTIARCNIPLSACFCGLVLISAPMQSHLPLCADIVLMARPWA